MDRVLLTREQAEKRLSRNGIKVEGRAISVPIEGMGLKLWQAADCLTNHYKYRIKHAEGKEKAGKTEGV